MTRDHAHNPDPNVTAARILAESMTKQEPGVFAQGPAGRGRIGA
ncbi:MAG TPA: hypothetical protein VHD36_02630 [Pirellulales bacterium]|nr:hypothetical protein [Pirellulales bacterium]